MPKISYRSQEHKNQARLVKRFDFDEKINGGIYMPKKKVEESFALDEGEYKGKIVENKIATPQGYEYHETFIKVDTEKDIVLKVGLPYNITENTGLGKLLHKFGCKLDAGQEVDTDEYLKPDMTVKFSVVKKKRDNTEFSVIVTDTLRPAK